MSRRSPRDALAKIDEDGNVTAPQPIIARRASTEVPMSPSTSLRSSSRRSPRDALPKLENEFTTALKSVTTDAVVNTSIHGPKPGPSLGQIFNFVATTKEGETGSFTVGNTSSRPSFTLANNTTETSQASQATPSSNTTTTTTTNNSVSEVKEGVQQRSRSPSPRRAERSESAMSASASTIPLSSTVLKDFISKTGSSLRADVKVKKAPKKHIDEKVDDYYYPDVRRVKIPDGCKLIQTRDGDFVVPRFEEMTDEERQRERSSLEIKYMTLNNNWKKEGYQFRILESTESLENGEIRYQMSVRFIASRNGSDLYRILLFGSWICIEAGACYMGIPASGYFETQLMMYDIYERKLIEMGQSAGFGKDWSPMTCILVYTAVNFAILVACNKWLSNEEDGTEKAQIVMRKVTGIISGSSSNMKMDATGVPAPAVPLRDPLGETANNVGFGEMTGIAKDFGIDNISSVVGTMFSAFTGNMGGGTKTKKKRKGPAHKA